MAASIRGRLEDPGIEPFARRVARDGVSLVRERIETLQVNVGKLCNQACRHCHVDAGPNRTEIMSTATLAEVLQLADRIGVTTVDITGGAPEMNPGFRTLVERSRAAGRRVMVRTNLTVMFEPGQEDLPEYFAAMACQVVASLPCYTPETVDAQRGHGVYGKSIEALRRLNGVGFGKGGGLELDLVYNPSGAFLPGPQAELEAIYKAELAARAGIVFDRLFTLANMPIARFADDLHRQGSYQDYMCALAASHNPAAAARVMCRGMVSVGWDGFLYDCDFNQMLDLKLSGTQVPLHVARATREDLLGGIRVGDHCYACTAGAGSSCGGILV